MFSRIVLVLGLAALGSGCGGATVADGTSVVAGFYPLAYLAEEIGGAHVRVTNLTPAGAEPHDLELTAGDAKTVQEADLVLYLGDGFQPALERALGQGEGKRLDLLGGQALRVLPGESATRDPHVWLDPVRYAAMARAVAVALGEPASATALVRRLQALDGEYRRGLADCARREIVTSHAAFGYLAARYHLVQIALTGVAPEADPSPRDLEELVRRVEGSGATTVFFERLVSPKLAETVAREAGVATTALDPLEGLTDEQLAGGDDYISVMRANLASLRTALGCR